MRYEKRIKLSKYKCDRFDVKRFYKYLKNKGLRPRTIEKYLWWLKKFDEFIGNEQITFEKIGEFSRSFKKREISDEAEQRKFYFIYLTLKHYFKSIDEDFREIEERFRERVRKYPQHIPVEFSMSEGQLHKLLNQIKFKYVNVVEKGKKGFQSKKIKLNEYEKMQLRLLIKLIYYTGLRASEVLLLKPEDVDFESNPPTIKLNKEITKSFHPQMNEVYLPPKLAEELKYFIKLKQKQYLFEFKNYRKVKSMQTLMQEISWLDYQLKKYGSLVHLNLSLHKLRHAFAHWLRKKGWKLEEIQKLMRHSTVDMTAKYLQISKEEIRSKWVRTVG